MKKGKTSKGFEFEIDQNVLDSWELLEAINEVEDNPVRVVNLINLLLGKEQKNRLIAHLGGHPSVVEMNDAVAEIFNACKTDDDVKN